MRPAEVVALANPPSPAPDPPTPIVMQRFTAQERSQLEVYGLWAVVRGQLGTDDSFVFNKVGRAACV